LTWAIGRRNSKEKKNNQLPRLKEVSDNGIKAYFVRNSENNSIPTEGHLVV
jgi:hypothetical protein